MITSDPRFRHVIFTDTLNLSVKAMDFAADPRVRELAPQIHSEDQSFIRWLFGRAGISHCNYRPETLARRLPACFRALHATSHAQARANIERTASLLHHAISALIIGVSSFFRDPAVFDMLEESVLPRFGGHQFPRIWSIGCSEGAELYSIAMLLADLNVLDRGLLLGTDCRLQAVRTAAAARYPAMQTERDVPPKLLSKYFKFDHAAGEYLIVPSLRRKLNWRCADVLRVQEPGPWDLILCRNMAMYMCGEAASTLWRALEKSLRAGGYLVLGKAERPHGSVWLTSVAPCIYRRDKG